MKLQTLSTVSSKQVRLSKRVRISLALALLVILWMSIQACSNINNECDKTFVKKSATSLGDAYQSDTLPITLIASGPRTDELSCFAFRNINGEIKLTFISSSDYSHFSFEHGDTTLVILYGLVPKDTLISFLASGDKKPGSKFKATTSFRMEDASAADIVAKKKDNQINFVLGT